MSEKEKPNPHNPEFIANAPWYLAQGGSGATMDHQKAWNHKTVTTGQNYLRGTKRDVKTKFIEGACENCGATTHTKRDCFERPRKVGAKWKPVNLASDDHVQPKLDFDYEGKRDNYRGYDANEYSRVIEEYEAAKEARRSQTEAKITAQRLQKRTRTDGDSGAEEDLDDRMQDFEGGQVTDTKDDAARTSARNLRIREDTAKYLINLDVNSAYYDPKTRSMREDPFQGLKGVEGIKAAQEALYKGDNFVRSTGLAESAQELQRFAWDAYKSGSDVHTQAAPTQAALMLKLAAERRTELADEKQKQLAEKYGAQAQTIPEEIRGGGQTELYVEYDAEGREKHVLPRRTTQSRYEEDVFFGEHSSVFGSYFDATLNRWGYACCRGMTRTEPRCRR